MINDDLHIVHARVAGLDIHKMQITASIRICDPGGGQARCETREFSALPSGLALLVEWLCSWKVSIVGMEATGIYWQAPWDALEQAGIDVELYHAQHVKQLRGRKTDVEDSRWLARVCQFGLGRGSLVVSPLFRELRSLSRYRRQITRDRTRIRNRTQKVLDRCGIRIGGILSDVFGRNGRTIIQGLIDGLTRQQIVARLTGHVRRKLDSLCDALGMPTSASDRLMLESLTEQHDFVERKIRQIDDSILEDLDEHAGQLRLLETIPGISLQSACDILVEIGGGVDSFDNARALSAWAGVSPGNNESAGKRRSARSVRGNPHLRTVLVECALAASRTRNCQFHGYHKALHVRRGYKRATVATAHKLLRTIYSVLKNRLPYRDPEFDHEALMVNRNAARWIRKLREYGHLPPPETPPNPHAA